jgi:hypothetical protein
VKEVAREVMLTSSLYETGRKLFIAYPLASDEADSGTTRSMVLLLRDGDEVRYFVLSQYCREGRAWYTIRPWPAGPMETIDGDGEGLVPRPFATAVSQGTPLPRDGSLFGWTHDGIVTALIAFYTEYSPEVPEPCWSVMPRAGVSDTKWPPFTDGQLIGNWFWELVQAGRIVSIEGLIAKTTETVFWADTEAVFGSGCCVVERDLRSPEGYTLPSGWYIYHKALQAGGQLSSWQGLLTSVSKTDLATRFH